MNSVKKAAAFAGSSFSNRVEKIGKEARLPCLEGFRDFASFEALQIHSTVLSPILPDEALYYCFLLPTQRAAGLILNHSSLKKVSLFFQIYHF
jgi:hypothetical protein